MADPVFVSDLKSWLRCNPRAAIAVMAMFGGEVGANAIVVAIAIVAAVIALLPLRRNVKKGPPETRRPFLN